MVDQEEKDSIGVVANWSWSGVTAKIKSRFLSAADRYGATKIDRSVLADERKVAIERSGTKSLTRIMEAATDAVVAELKDNPQAALRAMQVIQRGAAKLDNLDASLSYAFDDLAGPTLDTEKLDAGPDALDEKFLSNYEAYAERATDEVAREKWGRVLACEVRAPGTFSTKTLRVIDELDGTEVAKIFQSLCENRLGNTIPKCLVELVPGQQRLLEEADLFRQSDLGMIIPFLRSTRETDGLEHWLGEFGNLAIAIYCEPAPKTGSAFSNEIIKQDQQNNLRIDIWPLTEAGRAIATMVKTGEVAVIKRLTTRLKQYSPEAIIVPLKMGPDKFFHSLEDEAAADLEQLAQGGENQNSGSK